MGRISVHTPSFIIRKNLHCVSLIVIVYSGYCFAERHTPYKSTNQRGNLDKTDYPIVFGLIFILIPMNGCRDL